MVKIGNPDLAAKVSEKLKTAQAKQGEVTPPAQPVHMQHYAKEQRSIIRQVCVKAAAEVVARKTTSKQPAKDIIKIAEELENWITR